MSERPIPPPGSGPAADATLAGETVFGDSAGASVSTRGGAAPSVPILEGYEILGRLGEGGMGVVWRAVQLSTKRAVAVKLMSAASFGSERARLRFEREVELTASLDHPHIARIFDSGVQDGVFFYSMELIDGLPLDAYVTKQKLSRRDIVALMERICRAVQHAHQKGVIHRDLKPSNIFVDKEGQPHVLDFGLAKIEHGQQLSLDGEVAGTPAFMSPEQAAGRADKLDTRSDVYTLGVILFHLLSGQYPHDLSGTYLELLRRIAEQEPRRIKDIQPKIDADLAALLGHALEREPDRRYGTAGGLAADLQRYLSGDAVIARPPSLAYRLRKHIRKHRKTLMTSSVFLALILSVAGYFAYDYYSQWGDWIEVAHYDFTSEKSSTDGLDFIGGGAAYMQYAASAWMRGKDGLQAKTQEWCVFKDVHVRGDVRVVVKVAFGDQPDGFEICLNSGKFGPACPVGYSAQVGGYGGQISYISRNERNAWPDESEATAAGIRPGRVATITFERQGEHLTLQVDKEPPIRVTQLIPLTGVDLDGVAIRSWSRTAVIRSIAIHRRSLPKKASPVVAGDALVEAGNLDAALREYENLSNDYPHSGIGELALARACGLASTLRPVDATRTKRLRDRFAHEYPRSPFQQQLLESHILGDWQDGHFEEALGKLDQVRQLDAQTRLPLRLIAAARMRKIPLPAPSAKKLMAAARHVPGVSRLDIRGLGIESLADVVRPELRALECGDNPIPALDPLRAIPIKDLRCDFTAISSLEPLRGGKLDRLSINDTNITDLDPLTGMPLRFLECGRCQITSLEPIRGMLTLELLTIKETKISSLDPLRGLTLKTLSIGWAPIRSIDPVNGMPLEKFTCQNCQITSLEALRGAPLLELWCDGNQIRTLEPIRGMRIQSLRCSSNRIQTLEPLRGMPLNTLVVFDNPLTSLEPFVENPPANFSFDCDSLSDAELARVRDIWNKRPEHRRHARNAAILLALRHSDPRALQSLATTFQKHRYLIAPRHGSWDEASRLCRSLGGHLAIITNIEENTFVAEMCRDARDAPWIGLRRDAGKLAWENGEAASFSLTSSLAPRNHPPGVHGVFDHDGWMLPEGRHAKTVSSFLIEWDQE